MKPLYTWNSEPFRVAFLRCMEVFGIDEMRKPGMEEFVRNVARELARGRLIIIKRCGQYPEAIYH